jgi:hypothetical protein
MAEIYSFPNRDSYNEALLANSLLFPHIAKIENEDSIEYADAHAVDRSNNPELMDFCVAQGWAKESNDYLTHKEAWAVNTLGTLLQGNTAIKSFTELKYFINIKALGSRDAFQGCTNLKVIDFRNIRSVVAYDLTGSPAPVFEDIGTLEMCTGFSVNAAKLTKLKSFKIGKWFRGFSWGSFSGSHAIDKIIVDSDNPVFLKGYNVLINSAGTLLLGSNFPNLPNDGTVKVIASKAFYGANSLQSLVLPEGVTALGEYAFGGAPKITHIDMPSTLTSIGSDCFRGSGQLVSITCRATTPPAIPSGATNTFTGINRNCKIYVPADSVAAYKTATIWSGQASKIVAIPEE